MSSSSEDFQDDLQQEEPQNDQDDYAIEQIETGATGTITISVNRLKIGGHVIIEGHPCRIVELVKVKIGKHGHAKISIKGTDVFTAKRYEMHIPAGHQVEMPIMNRVEYSLIKIDDKYTQLVDVHGNMREDVEVDEDETSKRLVILYESGQFTEIFITVLSCLGQDKIVEFRKVQ